MIRAYRVIDETDRTTTYEYNSLCSYWLYASAGVMCVGYVLEMQMVLYVGLAFFAAYFAIVYFPALADARRIKAVLKTTEGRISGSRWSFSNPLRVTVTSETDAGQDADG